jgi:AcrR family transcriptional regulator
MNTPSRRDGEATRQRLIRAALELFTTIGFSEATTPEIARRAGVAEGTIYRHFTGKTHLFNEVYRGTQRWALKLVRELESDRTTKARERLMHVARQLVDTAERDPALIRMLLLPRDERHFDEKSRETAREFRDALQQLVAMGKSEGQVRAGPADLWTAVWLAVISFAMGRVSSKEWTPDHPQAAQTLEAAWDAIATRPATPADQ